MNVLGDGNRRHCGVNGAFFKKKEQGRSTAMNQLKYGGLIIWTALLMMGSASFSRAQLPTVAVITTGGTIAEKTDRLTGGAVPALSGKDLLEAVPQLAKVAKIKVVNYSNIDSSQMTPELWAGLSKTVDQVLADAAIKGAVITHGTDTMAEGSYFLDLTLKTDKPVVFVGAMRDASDVSADGPANILDAVTQVCANNARNWGVTVTLNQYINSARDVRKTNSTNVQTFNSGEKGYLGYIALGKVYRFHNRNDRQRFPLPARLPRVVLLTTFAGDDGGFLRYAVDRGAAGIVIEGVGAGNVNAEVFKAVEYALKKGVAVVVATRVYHGGVFPIYGDQGGGETLQKAGVILGGDLTAPKARILLMIALPQVKGDYARLTRYFQH
jgi:L-asparaginase